MSSSVGRTATAELVGVCSMATQRLLGDLAGVLRGRHVSSVRFEAAGGVDAARALRGGTRVDLAVLAEDVIGALADEGILDAPTVRPLFVSDVCAAVPESAPPTRLSSEEDLEGALERARRIAYSTGPSGSALLALLERRGLTDSVRAKLVRAEPGVPVGALLATGDADLGFQQRSELTGLPGVRLLGALPGDMAIRSTFSGAVVASSPHPGAARDGLDLLASRDLDPHVMAAGMDRA